MATSPTSRHTALVARLTVMTLVFLTSLAGVSAHVIKGLLHPTLATGFVSSPSATADVPIPITWGTHTTGLRVACFFVANTSAARSDAPDWPRVTAVGFELPGTQAGFTLLSPLDQGWELIEHVPVTLAGRPTTIDFALVAPVNPVGRGIHRRAGELLGIPPGQPASRGSGTRFCVSGPFPDNLAIPAPPTPLTIEQLINGVVLRFHGVEPHGPSIDLGVWENAPR